MDVPSPTPLSPPLSPTSERSRSPALPSPAQSVPTSPRELSEEDVTKEIEQILKEYLAGADIQEAVECLQELGTPHLYHKVVEIGINQTLERPQKERDQMFELFCKLHQEGILQEADFTQGYFSILSVADDISASMRLLTSLMTWRLIFHLRLVLLEHSLGVL